MDWLMLFLAGILETTWAEGLKYAHGFTRFWPSLLTVAAMGGSFRLLSLSLKTLPLGTAYAVWTGIGALGAAVLGIVLFGEPATLPRLFCLALIVTGIVGLKCFSAS